MPFIEVSGKKIELDEEGFLVDPTIWDKEVAIALAKDENIDEMTDEHWKIVNYLRDYYLKFGIAPMVRKLVKDTGIDLKRINELFENGPAKGACKVAGMPKPTGCV